MDYLVQTDKPNAGQPVTIQCSVVGNPAPTEVTLQSADGQRYTARNTIFPQELNGYRLVNEYLVADAQATDALECRALSSAGHQANRTLALEVFGECFNNQLSSVTLPMSAQG